MANVPDLEKRISIIFDTYIKEKELKKKNLNYHSLSWDQIVTSNCPLYLKNKENNWLGFVSEFKKRKRTEKEKNEILEAAKSEIKITIRPKKESITSKVNRKLKTFVNGSLFNENQLEFNF